MWREIFLAAIGATGFAMLFGVQRKRLGIVFLASGIAWYGYLILVELTKKENLALFFITMLVVFTAKMIGWFVEEAVILYTTPILIPFIPGATLYYVMQDLLSSDPSLKGHLQLLVKQIGAMVLGIMVIELFMLTKRKKHAFHGSRV